MPYENSTGRMCAVIGCNNSQRKLYRWNEEVCDLHETKKHRDCPCILPFKLHKFPANKDIKRDWIKKLNRTDFEANNNSVVCSTHFIDGKPTPENPSPQLNLGYLSTIRKGRRKLEKCSNCGFTTKPRNKNGLDKNTIQPAIKKTPKEPNKTIVEEPLVQLEVFENELYGFKVHNERKMVDKGVQWEDPSLFDHAYSTGGVQVTIENNKIVGAS